MSNWKTKKGYKKSTAKIMPMGGMATGKNPDATFVPDNVSKPTQKKHADFHKRTTPMAMGKRTPLIGE